MNEDNAEKRRREPSRKEVCTKCAGKMHRCCSTPVQEVRGILQRIVLWLLPAAVLESTWFEAVLTVFLGPECQSSV